MKQALSHITKRLQQRIPDEQAFFTPSELLEAGLPEFLVARIRLTLHQQLSRSIAPPRIEWADSGVAEAEQAWRQFSKVLHEHVRLPRKRSPRIIENAVSDVLHLLCEPREFLPRYLFAGDAVLSLKEARERVEWVVVYPQLGQFLPKYMQARELEVISRARYENALRQLDDKLVSRYKPADWLNLLAPLFTLFEGEVPKSLLQQFFEDKARYGIAERIQQHEEELLSQGLLLGFIAPDTPPAEAAQVQVSPESATVPESEEKQAAAEPSGAEAEAENPPEAQEEHTPEEDSGETPEPEPIPEPEERISAEEQQEEVKPEKPAERQPVQDKDQEADPQEEDPEEEPDALAEFLNFDFKSSEIVDNAEEKPAADASEESAGTDSKTEEPDQERPAQTEVPLAEDSEEETPLYARFKSPEDEETEDKTQESEQPAAGEERSEEKEAQPAGRPEIPRTKPDKSDKEDDDDIPLWKRLSMQAEEEAAPLPVSQPAPDEASASELRSFLKAGEEDYIKALFEGDEAAYAEALERLSDFGKWREAGKYITNTIFRKKGISMYSATAVDFTDRLHKFFLIRQRRS